MNLISKNKITFIFLFSIFLLPAYGANKDTKAIYELIERVTPGYSSNTGWRSLHRIMASMFMK